MADEAPLEAQTAPPLKSAPPVADDAGAPSRMTDDSEHGDGDGWSALIAGVDAAGQAAAASSSSELMQATAPGAPITTADVFHLPTAPGAGAAAMAPGSSGSGSDAPTMPALAAKIIATCNQLEEEPWLPVRSIVTMFRIHVTFGEQTWELLRRYSDFYELDVQLAKSFDPESLPPLPPKLMMNEDAAIASRFLELDVYLKALLANPTLSRHAKVQDFLGVEKQGARYGVRRYECAPRASRPTRAPYTLLSTDRRRSRINRCICVSKRRYDSAQSEGNRYIRDNDL
jgi:hypothetical protein